MIRPKRYAAAADSMHGGCAGTQCLMGISPAGCGSDCSGAPLLAPLYVACNLGFNIAALNLLRAAGVRVPSYCEFCCDVWVGDLQGVL